MSTQGARLLTGRHVLAAMIAFFAAVIAVNGVFIYTALQTFPGEDVRRSYLQGLNYNQTLAERRAQAALDWRAEAGIVSPGDGVGVEVRVVDHDGSPVYGLTMNGVLRRPADGDHDVSLAFESRGGGSYVARTPQLAAGMWDVRVTAQRGDARFSFVRRQMWTPPSH